MSRSYKKTPVSKFNCRFSKKMANQKVRRTKNIPSGKAYKKIFNSYNICDYANYKSLNNLRIRSNSYILEILNNKYLSEDEKVKEIKWIKECLCNEKSWHKWYCRK